MAPEALIQRAVELGLGGLALTEHHRLWSRQEVEELLETCGEPDLVVLRGQEVTTTAGGLFHGDLLVFGLEEPVFGRPETLDFLEEVRSGEGVAIAAHPFRVGYGYDDDVLDLSVDGLEVLNSNYFSRDEERALEAQRSMGVAAIGGSDAHSESWVGRCLTLFEDTITCEVDFIRAVKDRRCRAVSYDEARPLLVG
jgi:predicted metal-dependent phosphoesterase TrpH